jgi:hypothetical protein
MSDFWKDLSLLLNFQLSDYHAAHTSAAARTAAEQRLIELFITEPGIQPVVMGMYPDNWQENVPLDQSFVVAFDQAIQLPTLEASVEIKPFVLFEVIPMSGENHLYLIAPKERLAPDTTYTVTIGQGVISMSRGKPLVEGHEISFITREAEPPPQVTSTTPKDGARSNLAGQPITIVFDQPMLPASVEAAIDISPDFDYGAFWTDGNAALTIQSCEPLDYNTAFTVTIGEEAMSADGIYLAEEYEFGFATFIMNQPRVLGSFPASGASIPSNHPLQIMFDRPMEPQSVEERISITHPGFQYTTSWHDANMVLQIESIEPLPAGFDISYTISLDAGAQSRFGLPMEDGFKFTFAVVE